MSDRLLEALAPELFRHERAKSLPLRSDPLSEFRANYDPLDIRSRKAYLEKLLALCGVADKGQGVEAAEIGGISRTTLVGWRNPKALDRGPTSEALMLYEEYAQWRILNAKFARTA